MVAAPGPTVGAAAVPGARLIVGSPPPPAARVRRATLADVASVARLAVRANQEMRTLLPPLHDPTLLSAPEVALRLLEELDDGGVLYVAEREGLPEGFAHLGGLMVGDGGHLVEMKRLYVTPERRLLGTGRRLIERALGDLGQRPTAVALRAWAPAGSPAEAFLAAAGGRPVKQRWKVGRDAVAVSGTVYGWAAAVPAPAAPLPVRRPHAGAGRSAPAPGRPPLALAARASARRT